MFARQSFFLVEFSLRTGVDNVQRAKVILVGPPTTTTIIAAFRAGHARCTRSSRVYAVSPLLRSTVSDGADKKVKRNCMSVKEKLGVFAFLFLLFKTRIETHTHSHTRAHALLGRVL